MNLRHYIDPDTGAPHIHAHNVAESEVRDILGKPLEEIRGRGGSVVAIGRSRAGRHLRVVYSPVTTARVSLS